MNYETRLAAAAKLVYAADSSNVGETPVDPAEIGVTATLKPHQVEGLSWLIRRYKIGVNVVLGDEMGLGKTLQAISFLSYLKNHQNSSGPFLVLSPLSVTDGWVSEIANFTPKLKVLSYIGEKDHRQKLRRSIYEHVKSLSSKSHVVSLPFDVLLTTYDIVLMDQDFLSQFSWTYAIVDEAQRLKNPSSVLYAVLNERFVIPRRLLMTGTPIQNNLTELWALMHFCMPSVFGTREQFLLRFKETRLSGDGAAQAEGEYKVLRYVLGAFMLRRTKSKLIAAGTLVLPSLSEITVLTPLVALQKKVYMSILRKELPRLLAFSSGSSNHQSLQNIVIQLRKTCSHPYLFPGIEPEPYEEGEHLVTASGKLIILDQLLQKLHQSGHRVLLFAQMTRTLDILQDFLELRKYSYERLDGSVRAEERFAAIRSFSKRSKDTINTAPDQGGAFVFMISTRAGGVGLNLVAADTVIFYEQDWNPQVDKQALQRAHRIGQMNHVLSISLVTGKTVEEVIMRRAERKLQLSNNVIGENVDNTKKGMEGAMAGDLHSVIYGLNMLDPTDTSNENSDEIDTHDLGDMAETVLSLRYNRQSDKDSRKYEVNPMDLSDDHKIVEKDPDSVSFDPGFDEASYLSWVKKFEEDSKSCESATVEPGVRRDLLEERNLKIEAARKKAEEKKLSEWEAHGYHSLSVKEPMTPPNGDMMSDSVLVHSVYGDCTHPYIICPSEPTIVFSCTDDSGNWGHGGMFDALAKLSVHVPTAYERASNFKDLRLGDLHLVEIKNDIDEGGNQGGSCHWVALAVVQSYNPRRKVPRSNISLAALENCLSKVSSVAAQNSASIHMPRIGYQDASDRSEWYTIERLLRKYALLYGTRIYVYYYCRSS